MLQGKKIALGVTGGIAAYKAVSLVSKLVQAGAEVRVIMTSSATKLVTPLTFKEISGHPVAVDMWSGNQEFNVEHVAIATWADVFVVAPATANIIGKMAAGIADDLLSTTLIAFQKGIVICPAMNTAMLQQPVVKRNLDYLAAQGVQIMPAAEGHLACGTTGPGRLPEPEAIADYVSAYLEGPEQDLKGLRVLVTAGGTREALDPVRFLGNRSSGKMGYAIAQVAQERGAQVTLISTTHNLPVPPGVAVVYVESAKEMLQAVLEHFEASDIVVKAAAVADYAPAAYSEQKLKKQANEELVLKLVKNPDILRILGERKTHQVLVGFAAETENLVANAQKKLQAKQLDMIVANDVTVADSGFNAEHNLAKLLLSNGKIVELPKLSKLDLAQEIFTQLGKLQGK